MGEELRAVFAPTVLAIEHIGGTAIPGLAAKPVIDVLLGASSLADIESRIRPLEALGCCYIAKYERKIRLRR